MRRFSQDWDSGHLLMMFDNVRRRHEWFTENTSPRQLANAVVAFGQFALKKEIVRGWPVLVKVDISPLCNLSCTYCVHARPSVEDQSVAGELLKLQSFTPAQKMSVSQFASIAHQIRGKSMAVSLYYLGDPLVHPQLTDICGLCADARLNSHISTNFSFRLSDERIASLVTSGLTHLTACVDGMTQESYERTRVGGRLDVVLDNVRRLLEVRRQLGMRRPKVEVQFIKFRHNLGELDDAAAWSARHGVDQFTSYWGHLHNYTDLTTRNYDVFAPKSDRRLPQCTWPYFSMQIKYNGDVIPCCYHRQGEQYAGPDADSRIVGNVFESSVWEVWNSREYQALRRLVARPRRSLAEPQLRTTFCDGCPTVFETDSNLRVRRGYDHDWGDLYTRDRRGRVWRREARSGAARGAD